MSTSTPGSSRRSRKKEPDESNANDMPEWAKDLEGLWSNEEPNLEAEIRYNTKVSLVPPHCAICSLFSQPADNKPEQKCAKKPRYSKPLISDKMFSSNGGRLSSAGFTPAIDVEGRSPLVTCVSCAVCVHASCYGLQYDEDYSQWKCSKCAQKRFTANCWLCHLRGGALKRTTTGHWCHIVCALGVPEVAFESVVHRSPISVTRVPAGRMKMKCEFCFAWTGASGADGVCIQCCDGVCTTAFHVSCAQAFGIKFTPAEWPFPVDVICHKHTDNKENSKKKLGKDNFPVAKLTPRKSVSAGPRSSSYSPVRQIRRRSGSSASVPDANEESEQDSEKTASKTSGKSVVKNAAVDKSKLIVCLKFLSDTEVKRLSSPSASPMAKSKEEEKEGLQLDVKTPVVRRRVGSLSKAPGKKGQLSAEKNHLIPPSKSNIDLSIEAVATSTSSLPGSSPSTPTFSSSASPKMSAKAPKKTPIKNPEKVLKKKVGKDNDGQISKLDTKASGSLCVPKCDETQENVNESSTPASGKKKVTKNPGAKNNGLKGKKAALNDSAASPLPNGLDTPKNKSLSKTPDIEKTKKVTKLPKSPAKGDAPKIAYPKKPKTPKSPKTSPVKSNSKLNCSASETKSSSGTDCVSILKKNVACSSEKSTSGSNCVSTLKKNVCNSEKSSTLKSSPKKPSPNKSQSAGTGVTPSASVIKRILPDEQSDSQFGEKFNNKVLNNVAVNQSDHGLSVSSASTPGTTVSLIESKIFQTGSNPIPLSATQPLACSTPVQDISECAKDQQSPVTSRSRSGRAIKISSVAREAFLDASEENNFGFLMGCQSGESSPDPTKHKSFASEPKEPEVPATKKLHWKTLQKMERLRLEQEGAGAKGPPLYVPKTTLPRLPHNSEHIQAVIDMVVDNARSSVDREERENLKRSSSSLSLHGETDDSVVRPKKTKRSELSFKKANLSTRENGLGPSPRSCSPVSDSLPQNPDFLGDNVKLGLNEKLTDLIAKMSTRVKELPPNEVAPSSSSEETTPNKSFLSTSSSSKRTGESSDSDGEESSDDEDESTGMSSPEKSYCSRSRSPRFNIDEGASTSAQDIDWFKGEVHIDGLGDDNNNEAVSKLDDNLEELESSRDSFDYLNSVSNPAHMDSAEEPEPNLDLIGPKIDENNRILSSTENPDNEGNKKNAFFSAELENYLLNVSPVKQGEFLGSKSPKQKVEFTRNMNAGWKNSMDPDIDEVEGVIFFSFTCKEAVEKHMKKEKSSAGIPRQVSSSLAKYHAKIQQDAAVSGMGLYPRGSCKSLVKHLTGVQMDTLGLDLPRQACRYPDFSRENEWREVSRSYETVEEDVSGGEDSSAIDDLHSEGSTSFDGNVTRIYGRKSDGTFARKKMALPRLKRLGPALPVDIEEPPGLDKYESQSKEWGIVTAQIIQQRARELKQEGFTFPRKKPLVSYEPVTVTSSMAFAAAAALKLVPTSPREPTDTACKRPGCRYGCVCHLCESVPSVEEEDEGAQSDNNSTQSLGCPKQYCRLGCICDSIDENASSPRTPTHCGKLSCMFDCNCLKKSIEDQKEIKTEGIKKEEIKKEIKQEVEEMEPGEVKISEDGKITLSDVMGLIKKRKSNGKSDVTTSKETAKPKGRGATSRGRGRGTGRGRGSGRGRGGTRSPSLSEPSTTPTLAEASGSEDAAVRKSTRLKNKPLIGIGNIDRLNSLVFFDTVAWLADNDGPRKRKKQAKETENTTTEHQGGELVSKLSSGSKEKDTDGRSSISSIKSEVEELHLQESSDDAIEDMFLEDEVPSTCARVVVYQNEKMRKRLLEKPIKIEDKEDDTESKPPTKPQVKPPADTPERKSIKIKTEKISPVAKTLSPAAKQLTEGGRGDYVHPIMGKFKTQMVLLQRKRTEPANLDSIPQDTPYLLEIQSNCDWEGIRSQLLSKVSTEMNQISADAQYEYPTLTSFKIGMFIADILPRPEKATTIPPNLQRILKTKDMFPIRIRIIHSNMHFGKLDETSGPSPVAKVISPIARVISPVAKVTEQSKMEEKSTVPAVIPAKRRKSKSIDKSGAEGNKKAVKKSEASKQKQTKGKEEDNFKKSVETAERKGAFVGLSGLSRLNLKIEGYSGPAGPPMSLMNSSDACASASTMNLSNDRNRFKVSHPYRTPTPPPLMSEQNVSEKSLENSSNTNDKKLTKMENIGKVENPAKDTIEDEKPKEKDFHPFGQVMFIPITATHNTTSNFMSLVTGTDLDGINNQNSTNVVNNDGSSNSATRPVLTTPPANNDSSFGNLNSVVNDAQSGNEPSSNDSKAPQKEPSKPDAVKYVPAGFLVVPSPNYAVGNQNAQGAMGLAVKALVVGPQNVVSSTKLHAGVNLKSLPASFRLSPVIKNMNIPVKCSDGKTTHIKLSASGTGTPEAVSRLAAVNETAPCPPGNMVKKASEQSTSDTPTSKGFIAQNTPNVVNANDLTNAKKSEDRRVENVTSDKKTENLSTASQSTVQSPHHPETSNMSSALKQKDKLCDILSEEQSGDKPSAVAITTNCSIQSGAVKYSEQGPGNFFLNHRRLTPDLTDKSDDADDELLLIDDDESDSVDIESGDGDSILLALRKQAGIKTRKRSLSQDKQVSQDLSDTKQRFKNVRERSTHCSRLEPTSSATTTEKTALERKRRFLMCKLFRNLERVYETMCSVPPPASPSLANALNVPKFRLLQFGINTIKLQEEKEATLKDVRTGEMRRKIELVSKLHSLQKRLGLPTKLPPGVSDSVTPFRHESWFENRAKKGKIENDFDLEEDDDQDQEPAAFNFRPIEEVVADTSHSNVSTNVASFNSSSTNAGPSLPCSKSFDTKEKVQTHNSVASTFKNSIHKITQDSRISNSKPEVYIDYDDEPPFAGFASTEIAPRMEERNSLHHILTGGEYHNKSDFRKRKISTSDEDSPTAKECKT